jgi:hypothetical protein
MPILFGVEEKLMERSFSLEPQKFTPPEKRVEIVLEKDMASFTIYARFPSGSQVLKTCSDEAEAMKAYRDIATRIENGRYKWGIEGKEFRLYPD